MNRIVMYYSHTHENDTRLVYSFDETQSHLDMRYTDEDPDYGTDLLEWNAEPVESLHDMATSYLKELTEYLDATSDGIRRPGEASRELEMVFGEFSNSTLYAIENALQTIVGEQDSVISIDGNLLQIMTAKEAARYIKDTFAERADVYFELGVDMNGGADRKNIHRYANHGGNIEWFGCKLIPNDDKLFDGYGFETDYLFAVGHWGGGNLTTVVYTSDEYRNLKEQSENGLCSAICMSLDIRREEKIIVETVEINKEGK